MGPTNVLQPFRRCIDEEGARRIYNEAMGQLESKQERERRWRAGILEKVRDGRLQEVTPEERGYILSLLAAECPEAEA